MLRWHMQKYKCKYGFGVFFNIWWIIQVSNFLTNDSGTHPLVIISFGNEIMFWVCYLPTPTVWQIVKKYTVFWRLPLYGHAFDDHLGTNDTGSTLARPLPFNFLTMILRSLSSFLFLTVWSSATTFYSNRNMLYSPKLNPIFSL